MNHKPGRLMSLWSALIIGSAFVVTPARAAPLNLVLNHPSPPYPDIMAMDFNLAYNAGTTHFTAIGTSAFLDNVLFANGPGTFDIDAFIDNSGVLGSGTVSITDGAAVSLLTGNLTAFGFVPLSGGTLEFLFGVTGGSLAPLFGNEGGIIL